MLGAILPSLGGLVGGLFDRNKEKKAQAAAIRASDTARWDQRNWDLADVKDQRRYADTRLKADRAYAARLLDNDRRYTRNNFIRDRDYDRKIQLDDRVNERAYLASRLADDRAYAETQISADRREFITDRDAIQANSERLAEKSAASRGIDFKRLRDDAVAAGYNPMTALGMAHAYSTNIDYVDGRTAYSNRAAFQPQGAGYNASMAGGGGGGGTSAAPVSSPITSGVPAAGGFTAAGAGYQGQFGSSLSTGSFIADALNRGIDTWFNRPAEKDVLAESLRHAMQQREVQQAQSDMRADFGYDLTRQQPFKPAVTVQTAKLAQTPGGEPVSFNQSKRPPRNPLEKREFIPVRLPDGQRGKIDASIARRLDIAAWDTVSAGDYAELAGEVVGEAQTTIRAPQIQETVFDEPFIAEGTFDLMSSGRRYLPPKMGLSWK